MTKETPTKSVVKLKTAPSRIAPLPPTLIGAMRNSDHQDGLDKVIMAFNSVLLQWATNPPTIPSTRFEADGGSVWANGSYIYVQALVDFYVLYDDIQKAQKAFEAMGWEYAYGSFIGRNGEKYSFQMCLKHSAYIGGGVAR